MLPSRVCLRAIELHFASIHVLADNLAEVFVNEDVVVDEACIAEYHHALASLFDRSFGLIVNRMNPYTYSEYAKYNIADIANLEAIALLDILNCQLSSSNRDNALPQIKNKHFRHFCDREAALQWLESLLDE